MTFIDLTAKSPKSYRIRIRKPDEITTIVLHSMGFDWKPSNPNWAKIKAHAAVRRDGVVVKLHDPLVRMLYGSSVANSYAVSLEFAGNPVGDSGRAFMPEKFGVHAATLEQVIAGRELIASLCETYPSIRFVAAHRQLQAGKSNCPGPQIMREVGVWAIEELGLELAPVLKAGSELPESWLGSPTMFGTSGQAAIASSGAVCTAAPI